MKFNPDKLYKIRRKKNLTQEALGLLLKPPASKQYISKIENGGPAPRMKRLEEFSAALGVSIFEFFDDIRNGDKKNREEAADNE